MNKIINVTRSSMPRFEEYCEEIKDLWDTRWLTNNGIKHNELEKRLKEYLGVENICLFANGHLALELAIATLELPKGGEVITTPFTFVSTTSAIVRNGLVPVFCDINPNDYTIDVTKIESLITEKTCAILPVHVYGNICDVEEIEKLAVKHRLKVIYDAAHAFGVEYKGKGIATYGDVSMFSFHATKVFNTIEGGAVVFKDSSLKVKLEALKNFGMLNSENVEYVAGNAKMSEFHAAMGLCNLKNIDYNIVEREKAVKHYIKLLKDVKGIKLLPWQNNVKANYAYFPILVNEEEFGINRDKIIEKLKEQGIYARKYFYPLVCNLSQYEEFKEGAELLTAQKIAKNILALPLYSDLTACDVEKICKAIIL